MKEKEDNTYQLAGSDRDIPGPELDDTLETVVSEEEEYNFYSLGGNDHNDQEISSQQTSI
jgi:hypothetical protein